MIPRLAIAAIAGVIAGCSSDAGRLSRIQSSYYERLKENERLLQMERTRYEGLRTEVMAIERNRQFELNGLRAECEGLRRALEEIIRESREARDAGSALRRIAEIAREAREEADRTRAATERRRASAVSP